MGQYSFLELFVSFFKTLGFIDHSKDFEVLSKVH